MWSLSIFEEALIPFRVKKFPALAQLSLARGTPVVAISTAYNLVPAVGSLSLSGTAPTISISDNLHLIPSVAALGLFSDPSTVSSDNNVNLQVISGSIDLDGAAPSISYGDIITVPVATLTVAGVAPTISITAAPPLDDFTTNLVGAWSRSRKLLSAYTANSGNFDHLTSGNIDTWYDQSGGASANATHDFTDGGTANRRAIAATVGPQSRAAAKNDGTGTIRLATSAALSAFASNSAFWFICSVYIDAATLNNATGYLNDILFGDHSQFMGLYIRNNGPTIYGFDWAVSPGQFANASISTGTVHIVELRHDSGNIVLTIDGVDTSTASGNTTTLTGVLDILGRGSQPCKANLIEMAMYSVVLSSGDRTTIRDRFNSWAA